MHTSIMDAIRRFTILDKIADRGIMALGKYILFIRPPKLTRLLVAVFKEVTKNVHGSMPQYAKIGYGISPVSTRMIFAFVTKVKINMVVRGIKIAHAIPRNVCLYCIFTLCEVSVNRSSR